MMLTVVGLWSQYERCNLAGSPARADEWCKVCRLLGGCGPVRAVQPLPSLLGCCWCWGEKERNLKQEREGRCNPCRAPCPVSHVDMPGLTTQPPCVSPARLTPARTALPFWFPPQCSAARTCRAARWARPSRRPWWLAVSLVTCVAVASHAAQLLCPEVPAWWIGRAAEPALVAWQ